MGIGQGEKDWVKVGDSGGDRTGGEVSGSRLEIVVGIEQGEKEWVRVGDSGGNRTGGRKNSSRSERLLHIRLH